MQITFSLGNDGFSHEETLSWKKTIALGKLSPSHVLEIYKLLSETLDTIVKEHQPTQAEQEAWERQQVADLTRRLLAEESIDARVKAAAASAVKEKK
jgi:hypothetical protein